VTRAPHRGDRKRRAGRPIAAFASAPATSDRFVVSSAHGPSDASRVHRRHLAQVLADRPQRPDLTVTHGRIGAGGQSTTKTSATPKAAAAEAAKLLAQSIPTPLASAPLNVRIKAIEALPTLKAALESASEALRKDLLSAYDRLTSFVAQDLITGTKEEHHGER